MPDWLLDGQPDAWMPPTGRGLHYADGLFETLAFHRGRCALWDQHMARLRRGCDVLGLDVPDIDLLREEAGQLIADDSPQAIRITLFRSGTAAGYAPGDEQRAHRLVIDRGWPEAMSRWRGDGLVVCTSRQVLHPSLAGSIKHISRLDQVLIGREMEAAGADEALVLDAQGQLVEALSGNLVIERDGELIAPHRHPAAVDGVGLGWLRDALDGALIERPLRWQELREDDAIWVINSVRGPCPVRTLDGQDRQTGRLLRIWQKRWREDVES